jgi:hypothetical protein
MSTTRLSSTVALLALASPAFAGDVFIVHPNIHTLQSAVDAASDYDTILVRSETVFGGGYAGFELHGKSLAIIGRGGTLSTPPKIKGQAHITSTPSGGFVVLGNLDMYAPDAEQAALRAVGNAGSLWLQNCTLSGTSGDFGQGDAGPAAGVVNNADVQFTSCTILAGDPGAPFAGVIDGPQALFAQASALRLIHSAITGGTGSPQNSDDGGPGGNGGPGLILTSGTLLSVGSTIVGGEGGAGGFFAEGPCPSSGGVGGNGGAAIVAGATPAISPAPDVRTRGGVLSGGVGGPGGPSICGPVGPTGATGANVLTLDGTWTPLPGVARYLTGPSSARENTMAQLTLTGMPGDDVYLDASDITSPEMQLVVSFPGRTFERPFVKGTQGLYVGTIPPSGTLTVSTNIGFLPPSVASKWLRFRPQFLGVNGFLYEANPFVLVVLDQVF